MSNTNTPQWMRRRGIGDFSGQLQWGPWRPCTEQEAQRVTGLQSWQVHRVGDEALDASRFKKVPLAEITSAEKAGPLRVIKDHWWAVTADACVLIYTHRGSNSPQCNANRAIVERVLCPGLQVGVKLLPWAYLPFKPEYE